MTPEARPAEQAGPADQARPAEAPGPLVYVAALALVLLLHLFFLFSGMTPVLDGHLPGGDSYMRLLRVTHLYETGVWTDMTLPRSNWPYGESQNWTRPADLLLLSGALALKPLLGFERALFWWGSATAPLLHMAAALALVWAAMPLVAPSRRLLVVLALLVQIPIWLYGIFGRTDHHMLIILVFVLALGGTVRMMARPLGPRAGTRRRLHPQRLDHPEPELGRVPDHAAGRPRIRVDQPPERTLALVAHRHLSPGRRPGGGWVSPPPAPGSPCRRSAPPTATPNRSASPPPAGAATGPPSPGPGPRHRRG